MPIKCQEGEREREGIGKLNLKLIGQWKRPKIAGIILKDNTERLTVADLEMY